VPNPVTLIVGDEDLLIDRAIAEIVTSARETDPEIDVQEVLPATLAPGALAELTSPSLFGGGRAVVVRSSQDLAKDVIAELVAYARDPAADAVVMVVHAGGAKGKALLDGLTKAGTRKISCAKITKQGDLLAFVRAEMHRSGGAIGEDAARTLLDAVGNDLRELAAACGQLAADTGGRVNDEAVARYYRGRAEVSGFTVADRTVEGRLADALEQLRWALATGVAPVLITSALAQGVRGLAKVGAAPRSLRGPAAAKELGMPPWKVDRVRRQLAGWSSDGVARALRIVAETDEQVKGGGTDPGYALERAVQRIVALRGR
jgi:DNA polymerase-3 subunit delta